MFNIDFVLFPCFQKQKKVSKSLNPHNLNVCLTKLSLKTNTNEKIKMAFPKYKLDNVHSQQVWSIQLEGKYSKTQSRICKCHIECKT